MAGAKPMTIANRGRAVTWKQSGAKTFTIRGETLRIISYQFLYGMHSLIRALACVGEGAG